MRLRLVTIAPEAKALDVPTQLFQLLALVRFGSNAGMQRESADLAGTAFQQTGVAGQCLQGDDFASGLRAGGDAVGDRTHPQRVHAVVAASVVGQEDGLLLALEPAFARQMPAHAIRDRVSQVSQLRGSRGAGAVQAWFARRCQLKNEKSRRQVPVHPFVAEIGFLDWLGNPSQNRDALVFSELSPSGADGKFGQTITKKFCRYRRELRLGAKDVVFHSLRHSVVTALIRADAPQVLRREITGHKQQGEDEGRYFKGSDMCGLLRTISLVRWPRAEAVLREASSRICSPLLELPAIDEA